MNIKAPILVSGLPRSGTSIIASAFHKCGAQVGNIVTSRGLFENKELQDNIFNPILKQLQADIEGQFPLPNPLYVDYLRAEELLRNIQVWAVHQIIDIEQAWMIKDHRLILLWQVFHKAFPEAHWIIVRRDSAAILESCIKTGYMTAFDNRSMVDAVGVDSMVDGWKWWIEQYIERFNMMDLAGLDTHYIWPEKKDILERQLEELLQLVGLENTLKMEKLLSKIK